MRSGHAPALYPAPRAQPLLSTDPQLMVSTGSGPTNSLTLFPLTGDQPGLVLVTPQNLGIRSTTVPPSAPQLGSRSTLDTAITGSKTRCGRTTASGSPSRMGASRPETIGSAPASD